MNALQNQHRDKPKKAAVISEDFIAHARQSFLHESDVSKFIDACRRPLRKSIRVNTLKISVNDFLELAKELGIELSPIPWCPEGFWMTLNALSHSSQEPTFAVDQSLGNLPAHLQGLFYIQEASSMLPPQALLSAYLVNSAVDSDTSSQSDSNNSQGAPLRVLDMAAAPGSKTTQLASLMANEGLLLANEISASRIKSLHANLVRMGVSNTCLTQFDGRKLGQRLASLFDFVLLDAPCGGEGTVRKDPKALENWKLSQLEEIAKLQKALILTAYNCLKPGGRLVYSTCTLSPEENQQVASHLLANSDAELVNLGNLFSGANKAVTTEGYLHIQPQIFDSEGFFVAAFQKPLDAPTDYYQPQSSQWVSSFSQTSKSVRSRVLHYYLHHFGLDLSKLSVEFRQKEKEVWIHPEGSNELSLVVRFNRMGIKLAELYPNKIRSSHELVMAFDQLIEKQRIEVTLQQAQDFFKGRNIELEEQQLDTTSHSQGEVVLIFRRHAIGLGNLNKSKVKNLLPRDLVRDNIQFS